MLLYTFTDNTQKSKEKNMAMEDTRRRNEASMARKRMNTKAVNPAAANPGQADGAVSPSSTGAMDSLLEKLRAAAPQARDQRDRRRRARLRDRHQVRVASGQTIPDISDLTKGGSDDEEGGDKQVLSPGSTKSSEGAADRSAEMATISEGEDIADRAASMLQGLRGDGEGEPTPSSSGSLRVRRRRESADDERRQRRRRRGAGSSSNAANGGELSPTNDASQDPIPEEPPDRAFNPGTPTTVVSPPSPEGTRSRPLVVDLSD